ncbi:hypothetical protein BD289DRAFT_435448 [Coniella lustricola]|uniref:Uncharacterized protein n=1 Tax=Coniella lustricola TaxID=2025994 RepID=A0A2T3A6J2_9PEZI|nr:hypothetical protein BD289DRAFT_435448 [Coniella lustricola]
MRETAIPFMIYWQYVAAAALPCNAISSQSASSRIPPKLLPAQGKYHSKGLLSSPRQPIQYYHLFQKRHQHVNT